MKNVALAHRSRQRGFTLLELLATTVIMAICSVPLVTALSKFVRSQRNDSMGLLQVNIHKAVDQYVTQNQTAIAAQPMPYTITPAMLSSPAVYLDPSYSTTNNMGQTPAIRVWKAADGSLEVVIASTGGQAIKDGDLDEIAAYMVKNGAAGGSIQSGGTSIATGFQGSWVRDLSPFGLAPGAGHIVDFLTYSASATVDDALHRTAHPGNPALNTMSTNILMGGNAIQGVSDIKFNAANQGLTFFGGGEHIVGTSDFGISFQTQSGAQRMKIRNDGGVNFYSNIGVRGLDPFSGIPAGWGGGVHTFDLYAEGSIAAGTGGAQNFMINSAGNGYFAGQLNGNLYNGTQYTGNEYYANGWFRLNGATGIYWGAFGGGWTMTDPTWIRAYGDKSIYTGGQVQAGSIQSNSTIVAASRITSNEYMLPQGGANVGWGCSPNGLLGRDASGSQVVQCKNGIWSTIGGYSSFQVARGPVVYGMGSSTATCPGGWVMVSGGGVIVNNPYATLPGFQSFPNPPTSFSASSTDARVGVQAYAICAA